jgi:hypothetical protein
VVGNSLSCSADSPIPISLCRNYSINARKLFDENYGLASTQALKNKDIPEGGAKGTILPSLGANPRVCFEHYVDAIIDLLLPGQTPGIKLRLVDLYKKPEVIFAGPDEVRLLPLQPLTLIFRPKLIPSSRS